MFEQLSIIGVGLIGGSIAKTARIKGLAKSIIGYGREQDLANLQLAKQLGVIDEYYTDISTHLSQRQNNQDCLILAVPVASIESVLQILKPVWSNNTLYTDVGSTKVNIVQAAEKVFGIVPSNFIPAHPIAGAENSGVSAALDNLFINRRLIITPTATSDNHLVEVLTQFWRELGSDIALMSAEYHDSILAATSHLPHLLAFALVDMLGHKDEQNEIFKYAAGGFKDFTRIASSDPTMWKAICSANKTQLIPLLEEFKQELTVLQDLLQHNNDELFNVFTYANQARQRFLNQFEKKNS
jgi:prephenate dehydrogenase